MITEPVPYPFNEAGELDLDEAYAAARAAPGMIRVRLPFGEPAWLATRYADARVVLADRRFSRAQAAQHDEPRMSPGRWASGMMYMDAPEHSRIRTLVAKAFTMRRVERLRPRITELAEGHLDELIAQGQPVDLVENFAMPFPVTVICELLGVPVADRPKFLDWSSTVLSVSVSAEEQVAAFRELHGYMSELVGWRRAEPGDDLISALIEAHEERDRLSEHELVGTCIEILVAGHETTATQIPNFLWVLLSQPDRWASIVADPELIPAVVEELMRYVPLNSGAMFARYATEDVEVGGVVVRAGEPVLVAIASANRDERRFAEPAEVRFDRPDDQHLGFGHGMHHCLGSHLGRAELQAALRVLVSRLPTLHLAGEIEWKIGRVTRGPQVLPVGW